MYQRMIRLLFLITLLFGGQWLYATELVWIPINPSFGGSSFNAQWLMSQAESQNTFKDPTATDRYSYSTDPLENFKESLNRQILSRMASQLVRTAFGEDPLQPGHYEIGDYIIDVTPADDGINVIIRDTATGNETTIIVPYY